MSVVEVNDLFDELSDALTKSRRLVTALLALRADCHLCQTQGLSPEVSALLNTQSDTKPEFKACEDEEEAKSQEDKEKDREDEFHFSGGSFVCDHCGSGFARRHLVKRHLLSHADKRFECELCGKRFAQPSLLRGHCLRTHAALDRFYEEVVVEEPEVAKERNHNNAFECAHCDQQFVTTSGMRRHARIHCPPYKCVKCEKRFAQKGNARDHFMRVHVPQEHVQLEAPPTLEPSDRRCTWPGCGKEFGSGHTLRRHALIHSGEKPFTCDVCQKRFRQKSNLAVHKLHVHSETVVPHVQSEDDTCLSGRQFSHDGTFYCCLKCEHKFVTFSAIRRHLFSHANVKPFKCPHERCERTFAQKSNLSSHFLRIHAHNKTNTQKARVAHVRPLQRRSITCDSCPRRFSCATMKELHVRRVHDQSNPFKCPFAACEASFRQSAHWELHVARHKRPHACHFDGCEYASPFESCLRVHLAKHTGAELFRCDLCQQSFDYLGALCSHKRHHHHVELPLVCEWPGCGNAYKSVAGLRKHRTLHTGETKYACSWPECGERFRHLPALKVHVAQHTLSRDFLCGECGRAYATSDSLREHKRKVHRMKKRKKEPEISENQ